MDFLQCERGMRVKDRLGNEGEIVVKTPFWIEILWDGSEDPIQYDADYEGEGKEGTHDQSLIDSFTLV